MQQATSVQVVSTVTPGATPSYQNPHPIQIVAAQQHQEEASAPSASDDEVVVPTTKTISAATLPATLSPELQVQLDKDKRAVYSHPLFPLMAQLFEKCEQATQSPDPPTSASFDVDIEEFVHRQEREGKPFFSDDPEADGLMVKAIQVLRIHLLELEKVNELCKDFCHRYTTCLKGKMHSDILLRDDRPGSAGATYSPEGSPEPQMTPQHSSNQIQPLQVHTSQNHQTVLTGTPTSGGAFILQQPNHQSIQAGAQFHQAQFQAATVVNSAGQVVYAPVIPQGVMTPQGLVTQAIPGTVQIQTAQQTAAAAAAQQVVPVIHGSTPLSQIGMPPSSATHQQQLHSAAVATAPSVTLTSPSVSTVTADSMEMSELLNKRKPKRGVLPKHATNIMRSWLFQHIVHPYPTEDEKRIIAAQTNLTLLQVNNWFINARRRILQPMLDASNPDSGAKTKKAKTQNRPSTQRFWPESLANLAHSNAITTSEQSTSRTDVVTSAAIASGAVDAMSSSSSIHGDSVSPMLAVHSSSPSLGGGGVHSSSPSLGGGGVHSSSPSLGGGGVSNGGDDGSDMSSNEGGDLGLDDGDSS